MRKPSASEVQVVGRACRLPGAGNVRAFWDVLDAGRCTISSIPSDRWDIARYFDPRPGAPGKTYTLAAGVIEGLWRFDPSVFGMSPREALQMDPQQRLCLELAHEALEDAGLAPSRLAGRRFGVYAGASSLDYGTTRMFDAAAADAYFMTGNTLSLISNRVSHAFDLAGPSLTIDTACSSSLVALHQATEAIVEGHIEGAIVLGVNMLASPFSFIGFSQARMLAPDGVCRPFDADGTGYVRGEGAVALVLLGPECSLEAAQCHCRIVASGVNSDGRTIGVSLPSADQQARLLEEVYGRAGLDPAHLAFIEAHGTGTRAGDPAEAEALGRVLAKRRGTALTIGSVKSNIGHLEPASGLAGVLKAMLALEHDRLPRSLHFDNPNPAIPFQSLNIRVAAEPLPLERAPSTRYAGVNSFGFGGTNAHVVLADGKQAPRRTVSRAIVLEPERETAPQPLLVISAETRGALAELARLHAEGLRRDPDLSIKDLARAVAHSRDLMSERAALIATTRDHCLEGLDALARGVEHPATVAGRSLARQGKTALVFSGNGSQWAGMGLAALATNRSFQERFDEIDACFRPRSGWSLREMLQDESLGDRLESTMFAQPLLLAVQIATYGALADHGIGADIVLGHSVGEVAAAYAAGAVTLAGALDIIIARSQCQEPLRGLGAMATLRLGEAEARAFLAESGLSGLDIAAINSPYAVTLSGMDHAITSAVTIAQSRGLAARRLDLDYPFHSSLIDPAEPLLARALAGFEPAVTTCPFISTVTGALAACSDLGADYWWQNVRRPVRFADAVATAARMGGEVFIEIGPRPVLQGYLRDTIAGMGGGRAVIASLTMADRIPQGSDAPLPLDPLRRTAAEAIIVGARFDDDKAFGGPPLSKVMLPTYPWQHEEFRAPSTAEALVDFMAPSRSHALLGWRSAPHATCWLKHLDPVLAPWLSDHRVDGLTVYPASAYLETAHAAAREWLASDDIAIRDMEIRRPIVFRDGETREIRLQIAPESGIIELTSRKRFADDAEFEVHATCRAVRSLRPAPELAAHHRVGPWQHDCDPAHVYAAAQRHGNDYGPAFRLARRVLRTGNRLRVELADDAPAEKGFSIDPRALDAAFHGLFVRPGAMPADGSEPLPLLPVRCGEFIVYQPGASIASAEIEITRTGGQSLLVDVLFAGSDGKPVALLRDGRLASAMLMLRPVLAEVTYHEAWEPVDTDPSNPVPTTLDLDRLERLARERSHTDPGSVEPRLLLEAAARRMAYDELAASGPVAALAPRSTEGPRAALDRAAQEASGPAGARHRALTELLQDCGLLELRESGPALVEDSGLPPADLILRTVVAEHPAWIADCVLLQSAARGADPAMATLEHFKRASPRRAPAIEHLASLVAEALDAIPLHGAPRIGLVGELGDLRQRLRDLIAARDGRLVLLDTDKNTLDRQQIVSTHDRHVEVVGLGTAGSPALAARLDLLVSAFGLGKLQLNGQLSVLASTLAEDGALVAIEPLPDSYHRFVFGRDAACIAPGHSGAHDPVPRSAEDWPSLLDRAGFAHSRSILFGDDATLLLGAGGRPKEDSSLEVAPTALQADRPSMLLVCDGDTSDRPMARRLVTALAHIGRDVTWIRTRPDDGLTAKDRCGDRGATNAKSQSTKAGINGHALPAAAETLTRPSVHHEVVFIAGAADARGDAHAAALATRCLSLARLLTNEASAIRRLWLVLPRRAANPLSPGAGPAADMVSEAMESALRAFARTASNELPNVDIRVVCFDADEGSPDAVARLAHAIHEAGPNRELKVRDDGMSARRVQRGLPSSSTPSPKAPSGGEARAVLTLGARRGLQHLTWQRLPLDAPGADEVVIEVAAAGLNFRDVMWALGLLPEEALEDGFSGPTLGFECSGRIAAVGADVTGLAPGDRVVAMAPQALASHVKVSAGAVARLPDAIPLEAGATIPVAFLTAHYALCHLAHLSAGECVLIHGAAGGVGLAAVQIALAKGARVVATAGTEEKRDLLRLLGADHVLSSRTLAFADDIRRQIGGVDVVLNSLAGDAMEASLALVKPFGRFLELGKRDFYANTRLGLRPFRRNVSYFGIDVDQLMVRDGTLAARIMKELMDDLVTGKLQPLPYRAFPAHETEDAFRLMQHSGHIGKIVVRPADPRHLPTPLARKRAIATGEGAHIVIGGLGGFGLRTATWLADHGARTIVLAGRRGHVDVAEQGIVASLRERGLAVEIAAVDVTCRSSLDRVLTDVRSRMSIRGIVHAAAVLDDALIGSLDADSVEGVLAPKVIGAALLDELTADDPLEYLLLYSSVSTLVGNPGQAAYVAANGYLEGLARRRRQEGRPALAVRWGAITDAGMLARDPHAAGQLARRAGLTGLSARQALDLLAEVMRADDHTPDQAVVTIARMGWADAKPHLTLLASPLFAELAGDMTETAAEIDEDLPSMMAGLDPPAAIAIVARRLATELAHILRMSAGSISLDKPLPEFGLDSLMAVELRLAASRKLGVEIPLAALADGLSLSEIATRLVATHTSPSRPDPGLSLRADLAKMHLAGTVASGDIASLKQRMESHSASGASAGSQVQ